MSNCRLSLLLLFAVLCLSSIVGCSAGSSDQRPRTFAQPADTRAAEEAAIRVASAAWSQASTAKDTSVEEKAT